MSRGAQLAATVAEAPLGERIGPFIFWPLLAILVGIIVWAMLKRSRQGRTGSRPAPGGKSWTRPEDYREHHRVVWDEDPAAFEADSSHVPLAVAAVFGVCSGDAWDALGYRNRRNAEEGLQEAWGIRSRAQLLGRLYWILREGHRVGFQQEIDAWSSLGDSDAKQLAKSLHKHGTQDALEQAWRMLQVHENARRIRDTRFEAWDLVRASMLCRAGYTLGWLTEAEAEDTLRLLTTHLQSLYSDWAELGEHFMRARWYWGGGSGLESKQEDAHDASRQQALLDPARGPWAHVPWSLPVPDSRVLLADALVAEELIEQLPFDSPTPLAAFIDTAIASRLPERP